MIRIIILYHPSKRFRRRSFSSKYKPFIQFLTHGRVPNASVSRIFSAITIRVSKVEFVEIFLTSWKRKFIRKFVNVL